MITLSGVSKSYRSQHGRPALSDISVHIKAGQMVAVVGPNGSGKSTLVGLISGILAPDTGTIKGSPICSVVLQQTTLDPILTVRENAMLFARVYSIDNNIREKRLKEFAMTTGLVDRLDDRVSTLSGGLARRADLLRAVMVGPDLLILDEPTAGLDRSAAPEFMALLDQIRQNHEIGIVLVTHNLEEAECADVVLILNSGELVAKGTPGELIKSVGTGMVYTVASVDINTVIESAPDVVQLSSGAALVSPTGYERVTSKLLESNLQYSVRSLSLADVYDREIGGDA
jgi:ABC-type multidrug transport system ATPase subunit